MEARNVHADDPEMSRLLWDTTLQEVESGFLEGPFESMQALREYVGSDQVVVSRRFVIIQSGKPRITDDLRESGVNKAYTAVDALALHDVDYVASLAHFVTTTVRHASLGAPHVSIRNPVLVGWWWGCWWLLGAAHFLIWGLSLSGLLGTVHSWRSARVYNN